MILETFSLRLNWSTDGGALLGVNSLQPPSHCATLLNREDWKTPLYVVGHKGAVTVVCSNPVLFQGKEPEDTEPTACFALGAQARQILPILSETKFDKLCARQCLPHDSLVCDSG